jgi:hypothetical protein
MSMLYEQEIRGLGEHCVLPLIRFIQSPISQKSSHKRSLAIAIVSDLAPTWAIGDLVNLLSDEDAHVRFYAAAALKRLTAHTFGREPELWRQPREACAETIEQWQVWWRANRDRYTTPGE